MDLMERGLRRLSRRCGTLEGKAGKAAPATDDELRSRSKAVLGAVSLTGASYLFAVSDLQLPYQRS